MWSYPSLATLTKQILRGKTLLRTSFNHALKNVPTLSGHILDVGGTRTPKASYLDVLKFDPTSKLTVLNIDPNSGADIITDASTIPLEDHSVDAVICFNVLEHVENPQAVVAEMARVLKPGGAIHLETPFLVRVHGHPQDYHRFTDMALRNLLEKQGIQVNKTTVLGGGPFFAAAAQAQIALPRIVFLPYLVLSVLADKLVAKARPQYMTTWPLGYLVSGHKPHELPS